MQEHLQRSTVNSNNITSGTAGLIFEKDNEQADDGNKTLQSMVTLAMISEQTCSSGSIHLLRSI